MKISIKSLDIHSQNYNKTFELKKIVDLENKKELYYDDEYGECKIILKDDYVEIYRRGEINSKQVFKLNQKTSFTYITKDFKGKYEIFTKKLDIKYSKIVVEYDIMDMNEIINEINLEIVYLKI